ncbi:MAG: hypothetical protein IPF60_12880 [Betaproteobacteria bacterium]|nr:hypothetical protein [Betaproteobacteria bacterium]
MQALLTAGAGIAMRVMPKARMALMLAAHVQGAPRSCAHFAAAGAPDA